MLGVERLDRERLPLSSYDVGQDPLGDVGIVATPGVTRPDRNGGSTVKQIDHVAHFVLKAGFPRRVGEVVPRRQLGPDTVGQPEHAIRVREVPAAEGPVEHRWQDRIQPQGVRVHRRQGIEPTRIECRILGKLGGVSSRERDTEVDAFDVERAPSLSSRDLEALAPGSSYQLKHVRTKSVPCFRPVPVWCSPVEEQAELPVVRRQSKSTASRRHGCHGIAQSQGSARSSLPRVRVGRAPGQHHPK